MVISMYHPIIRHILHIVLHILHIVLHILHIVLHILHMVHGMIVIYLIDH
jgi:hypothetical protein